jgi:Domain of unknown function (DUF4159)
MRRWRQQLGLASVAGLSVLLSAVVAGSAANVASPNGASSSAAAAGLRPPPPEFSFTRLVYQDNTTQGFGGFGGFGGRGAWRTDAPEAEMHFLQGVHRLTRIDANDGFHAVQLMDDELFDFPFLYGVEVGRWYLSDEEAARLREYLLKGGFLMVDDFHGSLQWESFMESMRRVFPEREVTEIPDNHEVFHVLFDLDHKVQIPGVYALMNGQTYEQDGVDPHWRGLFDDNGRLMVAINFNMDLGDAWEHADTPEYPQPLTALAYRFGINYVLYSMSH